MTKKEKVESTNNLKENISHFLTNLSFGNLFKYFLFFILFILGVSVILALIKFLIFGLFDFGYGYKKTANLAYPLGFKGGYIEGTKSISTGSGSNLILERISYSILIKTGSKEEILKKIKEKEDYKTIIIESLNDYSNYAYLRVKVEKSKAQDFLKFLKQFNLEEINTNTQKISEQYTNIDEKIKILEKRRQDLTNKLNEIERNYQELITMAKAKGDIDALNKIYDSLTTKEEDIWKEIEKIEDQLNNLQKQKENLVDLNKYVIFNIRIQEEKIVNLKQYKEEWFYSLKDLANNFNNTLKAVIIGIPNLLLTAIRVIVYIFIVTILSLITIKALWKVGKRILKF